MAKYKTGVSEQTVAEADRLARANQRPGQTKEQTKLIAQGIQKGIEQYKKKQKSKARELDKNLKRVKSIERTNESESDESLALESKPDNRRFWLYLPWGLLVLSWGAFFLSGVRV